MSIKIYFILSIFTFCFFSLAQSDTISPQSIVVNPKASFEVEVWVDRDLSGNTVPHYDLGETIRMNVRVSESSYVYLFNIHSDGVVDQILPNRLDGTNNYLSAGETRSFPPQGARYRFTIGEPEGIDKVIALASKEPLNIDTLAQFHSEAAFASARHSNESFAQSLSIVVSPVKEDSWVTDTVHFAVGRAPLAHTNSPENNSANSITIPPTNNISANTNPPSPSQTPVNTTLEAPSSTANSNNNTPPQISDESITVSPTPVDTPAANNSDSPSSPPQTPSNTITIAPVTPPAESPSDSNANSTPTAQTPSNTISISPIEPSSPSTASVPTESPANTSPPNSITISPLSITPTPAEPQPVAEQVIFDALNLKFCAGTKINNHRQDPNSARVNFSSEVSLAEVHSCYHEQINDGGWQLLRMEQKNSASKLLASYYYQGKFLSLDLEELKNGNYRLKLSIR